MGYRLCAALLLLAVLASAMGVYSDDYSGTGFVTPSFIGGGGGSEEGLSPLDSIEPESSLLDMKLAVFCHDMGRGEADGMPSRLVAVESERQFDGEDGNRPYDRFMWPEGPREMPNIPGRIYTVDFNDYDDTKNNDYFISTSGNFEDSEVLDEYLAGICKAKYGNESGLRRKGCVALGPDGYGCYPQYVTYKTNEAQGDPDPYFPVVNQEEYWAVFNTGGTTTTNTGGGGDGDPGDEDFSGGAEDTNDGPDRECFLPGTKILLNNNEYENIELVKEGDYVVSFNEFTQENEISKVLKVFEHNYSGEYLIINDAMQITPNHPIMLNGAWDYAGSAKIGDFLKEVYGKDIIISSIRKTKTDRKVYNLEIEKNHNYYAENFLVHNYKMCLVSNTQIKMADNSIKKIEDIKIGDIVKGRFSVNRVVGVLKPQIERRGTYIINNLVESTGEHPFLSKGGEWVVPSIADYNSQENKPEIAVRQMKEGDILLTEKGEETVFSIIRLNNRLEKESVYDLVLDGDNTYIANGFIVYGTPEGFENKRGYSYDSITGNYVKNSGSFSSSGMEKATGFSIGLPGLYVPPVCRTPGGGECGQDQYLKYVDCIIDSDFECSSGPWECAHTSIYVNQSSPFFVRYESSDSYCFAAFIHEHQYWDDAGGQKIYTPAGNGAKADIVPLEIFNYTVDWDRNREQCELLGGTWNDDAPLGKCCGDDTIWVNNKEMYLGQDIPYNEGPNNFTGLFEKDKLCLYSDGEEIGGLLGPNAVDADGMVKSYECMRDEENLQYDPNLDADDNDLYLFAQKNSTHWFAGSKDGTMTAESDVGKHGSYYCGRYADPETGADYFMWSSLGDAVENSPAQDRQIVCELHLGHGWTGSACCGDQGRETYNDNMSHCNSTRAGDLALTLAKSTGYTMASEKFNSLFRSQCNNYVRQNSACYEGSTVYNNTAAGPSSSPDKKNILNLNGVLQGCRLSSGADAITSPGLISTGSENNDKCTILPGTGNNPSGQHVCAFTDESWIRISNARGSASFETLGYARLTDNDNPENNRKAILSTLPDLATAGGFSGQRSECCFGGGCWNGTACVGEGRYQLRSNALEEYDGVVEEGKVVYVCENGDWGKPRGISYEWTHDNRLATYCGNTSQCACNRNDCGNGFVESGCTKQENFFIKDHYCEAEYDDDGNITGSGWTTRTKLLAMQMIELVENGKDYTIFCDSYPRSINYPEFIEAKHSAVNSFCVLNASGKTTIGMSFNPGGDDPTKFEKDYIFGQSGVVRTIFGELSGTGESVSGLNCDTAIEDADPSEPHGIYVRCSTDKFWFNNRTISLIYSKSGLSAANNTLPVPDWKLRNSEFDAEVADFKSNLVPLRNSTYPKKYDLSLGYASDFSRLYMSRKGAGTAFGFAESKYDNVNRDGAKNYMAVKYKKAEGFPGVGCSFFEKAYDAADCIETQDSLYIADKSSAMDDLRWTGLTAKVR